MVGWLIDSSRPGKQFFSHVGTEPLLPGYYQYFWGVNVPCSRTRHGLTRVGLEPLGDIKENNSFVLSDVHFRKMRTSSYSILTRTHEPLSAT